MLTAAMRLSIVATIRNDTDWRAELPARSDANTSIVCAPSVCVSSDIDCEFCTAAPSSAAETLCKPDTLSAAENDANTLSTCRYSRASGDAIVSTGADESIMITADGSGLSTFAARSRARAVIRVDPCADTTNGDA